MKQLFCALRNSAENLNQDNLKVNLTVLRDNVSTTIEALFVEYEDGFALGLALYPKYLITGSPIAQPEHSSFGPSGV